jgi:hypothetical protein
MTPVHIFNFYNNKILYYRTSYARRRKLILNSYMRFNCLISVSYHPIHRAEHNKLLEVHNCLSEYLDSKNRFPGPEVPLPLLATQTVPCEVSKLAIPDVVL